MPSTAARVEVIPEAQPFVGAAVGAEAPRLGRSQVAERPLTYPVAAWLTGLIALSALVRFALAYWVPAPWIFADELKYSELAKSFASTGHFAIRDAPGLGLGPLYPLAIAPAYAAYSNLADAYILAKAINSVLMSLAAIPTYLLARRLLSRRWSLVAAALALAVPSTVYAGTIMTENLFYPLFLTAALGILSALERPSATRQLRALGLIALAFLTRPQAVALLAAFVTAIVAVSATDVDGERLRLRAFLGGLRRYLPTWTVLAAGLVGLAGWESFRGRSLFSVMGESQGLWAQHYSIRLIARWFFYHVAELDLYVGILPFGAFLVLTTFAFSRTERALRVFALASLSIVFWLLLAVAFFTSNLTRYDGNAVSHVEDRYTFYVVPLLLIALLAWVSQRVRASARTTAVAAFVGGALALALPYKHLIHENAVPDTVALLPWAANRDGAVVARPHMLLLVVLLTLALAVLFYRLRPPRLPYVAPLLVFVHLSTMLIAAEVWYHVEGSAAAAVGPDRAWIDHAIGPRSKAVAIWSGRVGPHLIWENEFFNRSVGSVYYLRKPTWQGLPEQRLEADTAGRLHPEGSRDALRARFVLTDSSLRLRGRVIAVDQTSRMRLYRIAEGAAGPVRLRRE